MKIKQIVPIPGNLIGRPSFVGALEGQKQNAEWILSSMALMEDGVTTASIWINQRGEFVMGNPPVDIPVVPWKGNRH